MNTQEYTIRLKRPVIIKGYPNARVGDKIKLSRGEAVDAVMSGWGEDVDGALAREQSDEIIPEPPSVLRDHFFTFKARMVGDKIVCSHVKPDGRKPGAGEVALQLCVNCASFLKMQSGRDYLVRLVAKVVIASVPGVKVGDTFRLSPQETMNGLSMGYVKLVEGRSSPFWAEMRIAVRKDWLD